MSAPLKKISLFLIASIQWIVLYPQKIGQIITPGKDILIITNHIESVKTMTPIPLDSILTPSMQEEFSLLPNKSIFFSGYDPYFYWFRFFTRNTDSLPKQLLLLMGPIGHWDAELFQSNKGAWRSTGKTGNKYRFDERPYPYIHTVFPLTVPAFSEDTFYIRMDYSHNFKTFAFALAPFKKLQKIEGRVYFLFGIMAGILLLFCLLNFYLFFSLKDKIHLWYSAYIVMLAFLLMKYDGFDEQFFGLDSEWANRLTPVMGVGAFTIFLLMHVVQLFLTNIHRKSSIYRITSVIKFCLLASAVVHIVVFCFHSNYKVENAIFEWANKNTLVGVIMILINCIISFSKGFKPAFFVLAGTTIFLLGGLEKVLFFDNPSYLFPPSLFQIGMVIEASIISFGLMYRYNHYKKEKESFKEKLELQQQETSRQVLQTQENEQKRIARDLHDELGGNLAAIKMTLQSFQLPTEQSQLVNSLIDKASSNARNISHNLMPPEFEQTPLVDLLQNFYQRQNAEGSIRFHFYYSGADHQFDKQDELMLYRILMELTTNINKHSKATEATIQLIYYDIYLELMAEDNGKGFSADSRDGIGLKNITSRVNYLKGKLTIDTGENGTTLMIQIPFNRHR